MQELQLKLGGARNAAPCTDHTGREFPSVAAMCRAWGIPAVRYYNRRRRNWSLERALSVPAGARHGGCHDHLGSWFPSQRAMCDHWGVDPEVFGTRRWRNWPLERALTTPYHEPFRPAVDPETGMEYRSAADMARACGVTPLAMQVRLRKGMTGAALVYPGSLRNIAARDHTGREFPSLAAMAAAWGQPYKRFERRLALGWDIERALTAPRGHGGRPKRKEKK